MIPACQLRPAEQCAKPPVYIRLSAAALNQIAHKEPVKVSLVGGQAKLMVGNHEYSGVLLPDPGALEVFLKDGDGFRSGGRVSNRLVLNETKPTPQVKASTPQPQSVTKADKPEKPRAETAIPEKKQVLKQTPKPAPKHRPLVHQAALGPITPAQLSTRTSSSVAECRDFLIEFAKPVDEGRRGAGDLFRLNDETFLYVRPWEYQFSEEDRKTVIGLCTKALDRLSTGPDHPARKGLKAPPVKATRTLSSNSSTKSTSAGASTASSSTPSVASSTVAKSVSKLGARALPKEPIKKRKKEPSPEAQPRPAFERKASTPPERTTSLSKRKSASVVASPSKRQKPDVLHLVKKFRAMYNEYSRLYKALEKQEKQPPNEVERLLSMHNDLAEWKSSIWAASREA